MKAKGKAPDEEEEKKLFDKISERYLQQTSPYYAAARLWVDAIIEPDQTREWIKMGIEAAQFASTEKFNPGVIQS